MDIYSRILTSHGFLHTNYKSLLMPYITNVHPRAQDLEDISQDGLKTSWKTKNCYAEDVLKTP